MTFSIEDRLLIHELVALHGHLVDQRRHHELNLLLTEDAVYDVSDFGLGEVVGLSAITALFAEASGDQPAGHHITNVVVTPTESDSAQVLSKGLAVMAQGSAGTVAYEDTVLRTSQGWRISRRKVVRQAT